MPSVLTCVHVVVSVQRGELFSVVPGEGVSSVAVVAAYPELVEVCLGLQSEAGVLCKHLPSWPVLQGYQQLVVVLIGQPVDVLQSQPILTVYISKTLLGMAEGTDKTLTMVERPFMLSKHCDRLTFRTSSPCPGSHSPCRVRHWQYSVSQCCLWGQMAERLGNRAINQKIAGSIPGQMTLCPRARHFTLLASGGNVPVLTLSRSG